MFRKVLVLLCFGALLTVILLWYSAEKQLSMPRLDARVGGRGRVRGGGEGGAKAGGDGGQGGSPPVIEGTTMCSTAAAAVVVVCSPQVELAGGSLW